MKERIWFTSDPVSRRPVALCITVIFDPFDIRNFYVGFAVSTTLLIIEETLSDSSSETLL